LSTSVLATGRRSPRESIPRAHAAAIGPVADADAPSPLGAQGVFTATGRIAEGGALLGRPLASLGDDALARGGPAVITAAVSDALRRGEAGARFSIGFHGLIALSVLIAAARREEEC